MAVPCAVVVPQERETNRRPLRGVDFDIDVFDSDWRMRGARILRVLPFVARPMKREGPHGLDSQSIGRLYGLDAPAVVLPYLHRAARVTAQIAIRHFTD